MVRVSDGLIRIAVVRLGQLGDLVMTLPALARLTSSGADVTLITDTHHQPLLTRLVPGIAVVSPPDGGDFDAVIDLHGTPAARRVVRSLRTPIVVRTGKESLARRSLLQTALGRGVRTFSDPPRHTWPERHLAAAAQVLERLGLQSQAVDSWPSIPSSGPLRGGPLGLVVGARHDLKRWPPERWSDLASQWRDKTGSEVLVIAAPWEMSIAHAVGGRIETPSLHGLPDVLLRCSVVVSADTGPLHLAAALGLPVVGLFGPTPLGSGFWVWDSHGEALAPRTPCSPCSLHGAGTCRMPTQLCFEEYDAGDALAAALRLRSVHWSRAAI